MPWAGVILDEAQNIKNAGDQTAQAVRSLTADFRVALTGTPVENHVGDLWAIMEFLNPGSARQRGRRSAASSSCRFSIITTATPWNG